MSTPFFGANAMRNNEIAIALKRFSSAAFGVCRKYLDALCTVLFTPVDEAEIRQYAD
jgi:hypothetical protein